MSHSDPASQTGLWHGTTILTVRKNGIVAVGGDGQVSIGQTIVKPNAKKVRRLVKGEVIGGFAGATADAFTLFERLEGKLEQYPGQLLRACRLFLGRQWAKAPEHRPPPRGSFGRRSAAGVHAYHEVSEVGDDAIEQAVGDAPPIQYALSMRLTVLIHENGISSGRIEALGLDHPGV